MKEVERVGACVFVRKKSKDEHLTDLTFGDEVKVTASPCGHY